MDENLIAIPIEDRKRQAIDSLRGYKYQIYQSLYAWLNLQESEALLLEVAEDYAVVAADSVRMTQVKDTRGSGNVTIKTPSVATLIASLWNFQKSNPLSNVNAVYLTTSDIGKERDLKFPDSIAGLDYWRLSAREGVSVEPVRNALLTLSLPDDLLQFLVECSEQELRDRILRRIQWACGEQDITQLDKTIRDCLVELGHTKQVNSSDAEETKGSLLVAIWDTVISQSEQSRVLCRADLHRTFDKATTRNVSASVLMQLMNSVVSHQSDEEAKKVSTQSAHIIDADNCPLPTLWVSRSDFIDKLSLSLSKHGVVWLYGSSGLGKTTTSILITQKCADKWLLVDLRDCQTSELIVRLNAAKSKFLAGKYRGVIFDDFPSSQLAKCPLQLSIFAHHVYARDGLIIFTSYKKPTTTFENSFIKSGFEAVASPYFSEIDVQELVLKAGGNPAQWAKPIHAFCGFGHPQLVIARIKGLQKRGWPQNEIADGMIPTWKSAKEVEEQLDAIKIQLMSELPSDSLHLLYALSLCMVSFRRQMAIAIGDSIEITKPGDAFDFLVGPWIEIFGEQRFRLSPLVSSTGRKNLSLKEQENIAKSIVTHLLTLKPFPADQFLQLITYAITTQHKAAIAWASSAIIHNKVANENSFSKLAAEISLFSLFTTEDWLFAHDKSLSIILRHAQFFVALENKDYENLWAIYIRLIHEVELVGNASLVTAIILTSSMSVFSEKSLPVSPNQWLPVIRKLYAYENENDALAAEFKRINLETPPPGTGTLLQVLFSMRSVNLNSIDELIELFSMLDECSLVERQYYLLNNVELFDVRLLINSSWLAESKTKAINADEAERKFLECQKMAEKWADKSLAVECGCARAVMYDEYGDNSQKALAILLELERTYPKDYRIYRQRQKILFRKGEHAASLEASEEMAKGLPENDFVERAFAFRQAGCSAAETNNTEKALLYFLEAQRAASQCSDGMLPMSIGLLGDIAMVLFQAKDYGRAMGFLIQACSECDKIANSEELGEKYCCLIIGHLLLWMDAQVSKRAKLKDISMLIGACSRPEPPEEVLSRKLPHTLMKWYQLAELGIDLGEEPAAFAELRKRTTNESLLFHEFPLSFRQISHLIVDANISRFIEALPNYIASAVYMHKHQEEFMLEDPLNPRIGSLDSIPYMECGNEPCRSIAQDAILSLIMSCVFSNRAHLLEKLSVELSGVPALASVIPLYLSDFFGESTDNGKGATPTVLSLKRLLKANDPLDPQDALWMVGSIWNGLVNSNFKQVLAFNAATYLNKVWREIIDQRAFLLRTPMQSVPLIRDVLDKQIDDGMTHLAEIALAAENGVKHPLPERLRQTMMQSNTEKKSKSDA